MNTFESLPRPKPHLPSDGSLESMLLVFCTVWTVGSLVMLMLCAFTLGPDWYRYWQLKQSGVVTSGQILRQDSGPLWVSHIFQFSTDEATVYTGQHAIPLNRVRPMVSGEVIPVRYVAYDPEISVLEPYFISPFKPLLLFAGLGVVMLIIGLVLLPTRWRNWRKVQRLYTQGRVVPATVVNLWRSADSHRQISTCVAYEFEAICADGQPQTVLSAEVNELAFEVLRLRQQTPVRYLPENPNTCRLEMEPLIQARSGKKKIPASSG